MSERTHATWYRRALGLYPRRFREEFGDDLILFYDDLVADLGSKRAARRALRDLISTVPRYRLEALMKWIHHNLAVLAAGAAAVLATVWLFTAVDDLAGGWSDTLRHWWSTLPVVALAFSLFAMAVAWRHTHRSRAH